MENKNVIDTQENCITMFDDHVKLDGSNLICIAARPGMGKTALALHLALEYAEKCDKAVYIFSCEMSAAQIRSRMICYLADVDTYSIREGLLTEKQAERIAEAEEKLKQLNIVIDDKSAPTVKYIEEQIKSADDLGMIVIDYLQLMESSKKFEKCLQKIEEISRELKLLSQKKKVPVIVASQLWRRIEWRKDKHPNLDDLEKTCGFIENNLDTVILLYREGYYDASYAADDWQEAEINIAKNRYGSQGILKYQWCGRCAKFSKMKMNLKGERKW